jgi:hypothetical protein
MSSEINDCDADQSIGCIETVSCHFDAQLIAAADRMRLEQKICKMNVAALVH